MSIQLQNFPLPRLRAEIRLVGRSKDPAGEVVWIIHDLLQNNYIELKPKAFEILSRWDLGNAKDLIDTLSLETPFKITPEELKDFISFLKQKHLLKNLGSQPKKQAVSLSKKFTKSVSSLVFFRLPLVRSNDLLEGPASFVRPLFKIWILGFFSLLGVVGLFLVARRWDEFSQSFMDLLGLDGFVIFIITIVFSKIIHELGHALSAKIMGCSVPSMGLAFILGVPIAYSDVSDSWRLLQKRQRLLVSAGGILAETILASLATWGWLIWPDGHLRSVFFILAATSWITTLGINLNPFMRFDGYYILSDLTGIRNLQNRSFAMGRWALRSILLGWQQTRPERGSRHFLNSLIIFAWITWMVRTMVFVGLSIMAYVMFGKLLGSLIATIEIWLLVMLPIYSELKIWIEQKDKWLGNRRSRISAALLVLLLFFLLVPQSFRIALPATLAPIDRLWVHAPQPAQLISFPSSNQMVTKGNPIVSLADPELDHQIKQLQQQLAMAELAIQQTASSQVAARQQKILIEELNQKKAALMGLLEQKEKLNFYAPFDGFISDVDPELKQGIWVNPDVPLLMISETANYTVRAYVDDRNLPLLAAGEAARFYPEASGFSPISGTIIEIESVPVESFDEVILASTYGGEVPVREDESKGLVPEHGLYQVKIQLNEEVDLSQMNGQILRGRVYCESKPFTLIGFIGNRVISLFKREFGI